MGYKRWSPGSRRDRRSQARGARGRSRGSRGSDRSVYLILGTFAVLLIALLIALAIATR